MGEPTDDFLTKTRTFWQSRTGRQLTAEDARQIAENVTGFLRTLMRWDRSGGEQSNGAVDNGPGDSNSRRKPPVRNRHIANGTTVKRRVARPEAMAVATSNPAGEGS
jgi:hypothetical protein